jgi:hypothetical protein
MQFSRASSFPPIQEASDEGELSDIDSYDYRKHGVVKSLGRTDLDDDSGDGLDELEKLSIRSKDIDTVDPTAAGAQSFRQSSFFETQTLSTLSGLSPTSQRLHSPDTRRKAKEPSSHKSGKRLVTHQSPNITRRAGHSSEI